MTNTDNREKGSQKFSRVILVAAIGLIALLGCFALARTAFRRGESARDTAVVPLQSTACRMVLTPLSGNQPIDSDIARAQSQIRAGTLHRGGVERLGWLFVKKARHSFDEGYYKLAEQCAACMESVGEAPTNALLLRAHVAQSLHQFSKAEKLARELVAQRESPFDYGVLGDVLIDVGKTTEGAAAYQKMVDLRPDLQSYIRAAHVRWLTGDLKGAIEFAKLASSSASPQDPEAAAWAYTRLSTYQLQQGELKSALQSCEFALALQSDYAPALFTRGRVQLAQNQPHRAASDLAKAAKLSPLPEYQWAAADALKAIIDLTLAQEAEELIARNGASHDPRTFSMYLATRGMNVERAVQLSKDELSQRGDVFTYDSLAWALAAAGRKTEAYEKIKHALSLGTRDARLFFHAGVIAAMNDEKGEAKRWLSEAFSIRQMLFPVEQAQLADWRKRLS